MEIHPETAAYLRDELVLVASRSFFKCSCESRRRGFTPATRSLGDAVHAVSAFTDAGEHRGHEVHMHCETTMPDGSRPDVRVGIWRAAPDGGGEITWERPESALGPGEPF